MGVRFIRQPSETPNINNSDDARLFRYALGGQNGYIKGYGDELNYEIVGSKFRIKKGIAVLDGYEVEVDSGGWELVVDNVPTRRYYNVFAEINLAAHPTQTGEIKSAYDTAGHPAFSKGADLTSTTNGVARLLLYRFSAQGGVISAVIPQAEPIRYASEGVRFTAPIPSTTSNVATLNGNGVSVVQTNGVLAPGWYRVVLSGGSGGAAPSRTFDGGFGGAGGFLDETFFVPHAAKYKLMAGGRGSYPANSKGGGGGGGGSVLDVPQLGILFIASGGGGGGEGSTNDEMGAGGGGGGGYGSGGAGGRRVGENGSGAFGGAGGGVANDYDNGGGMGGGGCGCDGGRFDGRVAGVRYRTGGNGGGMGGGGGAGGGGGMGEGGNGEPGGNNIDASLGGGASFGDNGYARIYKLG